MKKILLSILFLTVSAFAVNTFSQVGGCVGGPNNCSIAVGNTVITIQSAVTNPGNPNQILVKFNVAFDLSYNNGNTDFFINSFLAADYPNYWPCGNGNFPAPTNALASGKLGMARDQLNRSFLDIELSNPARGAVGVPVNMPIASTYQYDNTVVLTHPGNSPGMTATKVFLSGTTDRVTILNATVIINALITDPIKVKTDVWAQNGNAHCYQAGITQAFNDPSIIGSKNCNQPGRQYQTTITTAETTPTTLTYSVWIDMNSNNIIDGGDIQTVGPVNYPGFSSTNPYTTAGFVNYTGGNIVGTGDKNLIVSAQTPLTSNAITKILIQPQCSNFLPVEFKTFTATRSKANVMLKWETSTEKNNSGFAIERSTDGTNWVQVGYVVSQALGGNSNLDLTYQYIDLNNTKGISQYRIRQVDIDSRSKFSEVRSVKGEGQIGKVIVYPNPTTNGKVNVVFDDAAVVRDITVMDMSGRTIQSIRGITNNNVTINNLQPGIYTLRIFVPETGEQAVEKIVVNQR